MSFFNAGSSSSVVGTSTQNSSTAKDIEVVDPPPDSISSLSWSPQGDFLAAGSWDNNVRIYEVGANGQSQGKAMYGHEGPVMSVCWSKDGTKVLSGGADKAARMFDVQSGQSSQVAVHDAPIKAVKWIEAQGGILATGSWDKTIKYWDLRQQSPVATATLPERCYTMDVAYPLMVVGCAERKVNIYNLAEPTKLYRTAESPLKFQTRVVACFPAADGYAIGSVEGRVAISYVDEKVPASQNFSFKCHRRDQSPQSKDQHTLVFAVNDISFHQQHGTFSTAGSDGTITFWDKDSRTRLKTFDAVPGPISSTAFNRTGTIFSYATSYDWSKGYSGNVGISNKIMLHACKDEEVKKKPKK
ncbi:WD40 repeat-like protein [Gautieria morchelliformis]|nr:WD40 repeat-like protein [Gautieria morchelliformis]